MTPAASSEESPVARRAPISSSDRKRCDPWAVGTRRSSEARFGPPTYGAKVRSPCEEGQIAYRIWFVRGTVDYSESAGVAAVS
jgi:hypothetical protein